MERKRIYPKLDDFPEALHPLLEGADIYDSSCSTEARVWFIDRDGGYYLKAAPPRSLEREAVLTDYFHSKGLTAKNCYYRMGHLGHDWMLNERVAGEDCTHADYLADPKRLATLLGERLRMLHELDCADCPFPDHLDRYYAIAEQNYKAGGCDLSYSEGFGDYRTPEEAQAVIERDGHLLKADTLLHGDYCLPNVMLDDWSFSGFIDLGNGGVGDRHVDLYWGVWTLRYNLGTDAYADRFLDAYGRDKVESELFPIVAAFEVFG